MICPHCHKNVKRKERTGRQCTFCKKRFALEPKENRLNLHDVRLMRLAGQLSGNGSFRYTTNQLYYAAVRKSLPARLTMRAGPVLVPFGAFVLAMIGVCSDKPLLVVVAAALVIAWVFFVVYPVANPRKRRIVPSMTYLQFVQALDQWGRTYGSDLAGMVREDQARLPGNPPQPGTVLLCPDRPTLAGLAANHVPQRHNLALAQHVHEVPAGVPVVLLHDVGIEGYQFAAHARAALGGRVVADVSPRPATVKAAKSAVRLRNSPPPPEAVGWLRASGLVTGDEAAWLAKGWWSPVAALRPSTVIGRVTTAVDRTADPDRRAAAGVGFLTWPGAGRTA
jgi:hypothetical protein